ncbi:hypothetical protein A9Q99_20930 [Gammaproteobacteria bacterium 45_16_T64]|nr:hypothetical protein A9Q99_20930 [Gammaproteobacteria bacterium 45_16_T64]
MTLKNNKLCKLTLLMKIASVILIALPLLSCKSSTFLSPTDSYINYDGRVHLTEEFAEFGWAGTQIRFKVSSSEVAIKLSDGNNDYNVIIDNEFHSIISTTYDNNRYVIPLEAGVHSVAITKRNGPNFGSAVFEGIELAPGSWVYPADADPSHKIEFIGDSWTVGYGNEGPSLQCGSYRPYENSFNSFASIAARQLNAEAHLIAITGRGLVRNYGDDNTTSERPMPFYYNRTIKDRTDVPWGFDQWKPDAIVVKLGTNDHTTAPVPSDDEFSNGYSDFIETIEAVNGRVPIFLVADEDSGILNSNRIQAVVQAQRDGGKNNIHYVLLPGPTEDQLGCDYHPLVTSHQVMADVLASEMQNILQWDE